MLKPGDRVPDFKAQALMPNGNIESIGNIGLRGQWGVLFFWPMDFTFVCPTEIRGFEKLHKDFEKQKCLLFGASTDSVYAHKAWVDHGLGKLSFPIIGDVGKTVANAFGVLDAQGVALRATFIFNPAGLIESVTANALNVGRSPSETLRLVAAFQSGELTGCEWQPGEQFVAA